MLFNSRPDHNHISGISEYNTYINLTTKVGSVLLGNAF